MKNSELCRWHTGVFYAERISQLDDWMSNKYLTLKKTKRDHSSWALLYYRKGTEQVKFIIIITIINGWLELVLLQYQEVNFNNALYFLFTFYVWKLKASSGDHTKVWCFWFRLSSYCGYMVACGQHIYVPYFRPLRLDSSSLFIGAGSVCRRIVKNPLGYKVYVWAFPFSFSNTYT